MAESEQKTDKTEEASKAKSSEKLTLSTAKKVEKKVEKKAPKISVHAKKSLDNDAEIEKEYDGRVLFIKELKKRAPEELEALNDRLRAEGIWTAGNIDHGFCFSSYCEGPEGTCFEFATDYPDPHDPDDWIDPKAAKLYDVSLSDIARFKG